MVSVIWISLSPEWSLYSVQAGLQVVIAVFCFIGVFVFTRLCWQAASLDLAKDRPVSLPSLISIHTLSEVYDAILLLRFRIFHRTHWKILAQCIIVLVLSISTIVSGPIAKASTRLGTVVRTVDASGLQSNRDFNSYTYGYVQWNETISKLNKAGFPADQLLDYLPDARFDWVYKQEEWNSSWAMSCNKTESTPITLSDTGECKSIYTELPGLNDIFPADNFSNWYVANWGLTEGFFHTRDALLIMTGWTPDLEETMQGFSSLTFSVAAVLMSSLNQNLNSNDDCYFDEGKVGSSSYTLAQCEIWKVLRVDETDVDAAYPDHRALVAVSAAYIAHFSPRIARESASDLSISPITPDELIRFYQAYSVSKDTFTEHPVNRSISHRIQIPQLSATFAAFGALVFILNTGGLLYVLWFTWKHFDLVLYTPESKLDWAVQSIGENPGVASPQTTTTTPVIGTQSHKRFSVVASMASGDHLTMRKANRLRAFFENARYGSHYHSFPHENIPLAQFASPMGISGVDDRSRAVTSPTGIVSPPEQPLYNISPYEAQFAGYDTAYFPGQSDRNPDYFVARDDRTGITGWNARGYQRVGRPDA